MVTSCLFGSELIGKNLGMFDVSEKGVTQDHYKSVHFYLPSNSRDPHLKTDDLRNAYGKPKETDEPTKSNVVFMLPDNGRDEGIARQLSGGQYLFLTKLKAGLAYNLPLVPLRVTGFVRL